MDFKNRATAFLWDAWCISSVIGIWPRYVEPKFLCSTNLQLTLPSFPRTKIVHCTDLHFSHTFSKAYLCKIKNKINSFKPDLVLFTGDLISFGKVEEEEVLENFLKNIDSRLGVYASLGNHDYEEYISKNDEGNFDIADGNTHFIIKSLKQLKAKKNRTPITTEDAKKVLPNTQLINLYKRAGVQLLHNETSQININGTLINVTGLGDYWASGCKPDLAFTNYQKGLPGLVLSHNPDSIHDLTPYPGTMIFSGHTHGGGVNLPFIWKMLKPSTNLELKKGLFAIQDKWLYVNRGLGSHQNLRFFSPPEILYLEVFPS